MQSLFGALTLLNERSHERQVVILVLNPWVKNGLHEGAHLRLGKVALGQGDPGV